MKIGGSYAVKSFHVHGLAANQLTTPIGEMLKDGRIDQASAQQSASSCHLTRSVAPGVTSKGIH